MKQQKELPEFENLDKFQEIYQLDTLNKLGAIMCKWLFRNEEAKTEHTALFEYLLNVISDEKKRPKPKINKLEDAFERPLSDPQIQDHGYYIQNMLPELFSGKNFQGVHPLLPLALYGGLGRLKSRDFFKSVIQDPPQTSSFPNYFNNAPAPQYKFNLENTADISVPIPQVKYTLKEDSDSSQLVGDLPNRLSEVLRNDRLQHSLFNLLIANLSKTMQAPAPLKQPMPAGNWNSSSDQFKDGSANSRDSDNGQPSSPPFRAIQQPRNTGFCPVNLANIENRTVKIPQVVKDYSKLENIDSFATHSKENRGLTEVRKSTENVLKCSKCLLTSKVCSCLL